MRRAGLWLAGLVLGTTGCTWLMGHGDVQQPRSPVQVAAPLAQTSLGAVTAQVRFLGVGERVLAARNVWGRVGRVVNPYGADTLVFEARLVNGSAEPVTVLPGEARLQVGAGDPLRPRSLDDFRKRWPTFAVASAQQGEDRDLAYRHVLETLLLERLVAPGAQVEGRLAFPLAEAPGAMTLRLPMKQGRSKPVFSFKWEER